MNKYAGKEDYTQEDINMIVGVGFDELNKRLCRMEEKISQFIFRTESERTKYSNACYEIDKILSKVCDLHERDMEQRYSEADALGMAVNSLAHMAIKKKDTVTEIDQQRKENTALLVDAHTLHKDADES